MASKCIILSGTEMHHGCLGRKTVIKSSSNSNPFNNKWVQVYLERNLNRCAPGPGKKRKFHSTQTQNTSPVEDPLGKQSQPGQATLLTRTHHTLPPAWAETRGNRARSTHTFQLQVHSFHISDLFNFYTDPYL